MALPVNSILSSQPAAGLVDGVNSALDPQSLNRLKTAGADGKAKAEAVATQLESVFYTMMMKSMRDTVPEDSLLGNDTGGNTYVEMLDQQFMQMGNLPRDPRFHESLVNAIEQSPDGASQVLSRMK